MTTAPVAYKGIEAAAKAVGVSERTMRRALQNTDPKVYPPPLSPDGRHGEAGALAFLDSTLRGWVVSLETFLD